MRVQIDHAEKKEGLVFKTTYHCINVTVDFSNEELAIIKHRKLERDVVLERDPPANIKLRSGDPLDIWHLTIHKLMKNKPDTHIVTTPLDAKYYESQLVERLKVLKDYILGNAEGGSSKSFEL